jgi:hypothetical protein
MALRNTLLACAAIISGGGIAGMAMQQRPFLPSTDYASSSSSYGTPSQDSSGSYGAPQPPNDQQPQYGQQQAYGQQQQQQYGPGQSPSDQQQGYGTAPSYGQSQQYAPPQQYGQSAPGPAPSGGSQEGAVSLTQMERADRLLPRMPVESANGQRLGEVAQVLMRNGRAEEVLLDQGTRIPASDLVYVPARSVLVAQANNGPSSGYGANGSEPAQPGGQSQGRPPYPPNVN